MKVVAVRGREAGRLLASCDFEAQWMRLWHACPWATGHQLPGFAVPWYRLYESSFEPVLVIRHGVDGQIEGLLTLALSRTERKLVAAGNYQSEYDTWLCRPELGDTFAAEATATVRRELGARLVMHYLAPGSPTGWLSSDARHHVVSKAYRRPLMRLDNLDHITASLKKSGNASRLKRLKRLGELEFRRIVDRHELESLFDEIIAYHDSRHMAVHGTHPFRTDPIKKEFYLTLAEQPGVLHTSVLKVGGQIAAAHLGVFGKKELALGIIAHNPVLAKYSPGKFLIYFLAQALASEGFERLDLTSGGDPYKERFTDDSDEVISLTCFESSSARARFVFSRQARESTRKGLARLGIRPQDVRAVLTTFSHTLTKLTGQLLGQSGKPHPARSEPLVYVRDLRNLERNPNSPTAAKELDGPRRNRVDDLLCYQPQAGGPSLQTFMSSAMQRLERGDHVYTWVVDGRLLNHAWFKENAGDLASFGFPNGLQLPPGQHAIVYDLATAPHARRRGHATRALGAILKHAREIENIGSLAIVLPADAADAIRLVQRAGFVRAQRECAALQSSALRSLPAQPNPPL